MAYRLFFHPRAEQALLRAPRKLQGERDTWRVRVGDWRVVYVPNDDAKAVIVTVIGHRREVYE